MEHDYLMLNLWVSKEDLVATRCGGAYAAAAPRIVPVIDRGLARINKG